MNASPNPESPDDFDDFEYQLEEAAPPTLCVHCGARLNTNRTCDKCGALIDKIEEVNEDVELDEYGMPVGKRRESKSRFTGMLELEEDKDGELPAAFYAIALGALVLVSLIALTLDAPVTVTWVVGIGLGIGGLVGLVVGYQGMLKELGPWTEVSRMPLHAMINTFSAGACEQPPQNQWVDIGKWSILAMTIGVLSMATSYVLNLVM